MAAWIVGHSDSRIYHSQGKKSRFARSAFHQELPMSERRSCPLNRKSGFNFSVAPSSGCFVGNKAGRDGRGEGEQAKFAIPLAG